MCIAMVCMYMRAGVNVSIEQFDYLSVCKQMADV